MFSTDFLSTESYTASKNIIADYNETVGAMRSLPEKLHGAQPGDPKKLAAVVVDIAHAENPPLHLPIGKDAVGTYKANAEKTGKEIDQWLAVSTSTDHDKVLQN